MRQLDGGRGLTELARTLADTVVEPASTTCCGFAGDRGLLHRELTKSATRDEAAEVMTLHADTHRRQRPRQPKAEVSPISRNDE